MRSTLVSAALLLHCVGLVVAVSGSSGQAGNSSGDHGYWNTSTSATILKTIRSTILTTVSTATEHVVSTGAPTPDGIAAHILHGLGIDTTSAPSTSTSAEKSVGSSVSMSNSSSMSALRGTGTAPTTLSSTAATSNNRTFATTSMTGLGWATYRNQTFKSICSSNDLACYSTCTKMVSACQSDREDWSARSRAHDQSVALSLYGDSLYDVATTTTWTRSAKTLYSYSLTYVKTTLVTEAGPYNNDNIRYNTTEVSNPACKTSECADSQKSIETTDAYYETSVYMTSEVISQPYAVGSSSFPYSVEPAVTRIYTQTEEFQTTFPEPPPSCTVSQYYNCSVSADCNKCTITGGTVQLLYFPVSRTTSGQPQPTTTITTGPPITALYKNMTMTDPSVYISFETAYAENECGTQVGGRYHGAILPLKPGELSSVYGLWGTSYTAVDDPLGVNIPQSTPFLRAGSFNLADLNWPVPASAYMNQPRFGLGKDTFSVVFDDYSPQLAVPPEIRSMDPAWKSCALDWQGLYDPPLPLKPADSIASVTMSVGSGPTSDPAKPGSSSNLKGPAKTQSLDPGSTASAERASSSSAKAAESSGESATTAQQQTKASTSAEENEAAPTASDPLLTSQDPSDPKATSVQSAESSGERATSKTEDLTSTVLLPTQSQEPTQTSDSGDGSVVDPSSGHSEDPSETTESSAGDGTGDSVSSTAMDPTQSGGINRASSTIAVFVPTARQSDPAGSPTRSSNQAPDSTDISGSNSANDPNGSSESTFVSQSPTATIVANDDGAAAIVVGSTTQAVGHLTTLEAGETALVVSPTNSQFPGQDATQQPAVTHTLSAFGSGSSQNAEGILQAASSSAADATATGDAAAAPIDDTNSVPSPVTTIGSHVISLATESGEVAIDGVHLKPESTTVQYGTFYSYGSHGIVVGDTTIPTSVIPATPAAWTDRGAATDASQLSGTDDEGDDPDQSMSAVGVIRLTGGPATNMPSPTPEAAAVLTVASQQYTQDASSNFVIDGQTLRPGVAITVSGTTISLPMSVTHAVVNDVTESFGRTSETYLPVLAVGSQQYTQDSSSHFEIDGQTLQPGVAITVSGTTLSFPASGSYAVVNGVTESFSQASETPMPVFSIGSHRYTQDPSSQFVVGGQTLEPGSAITVSGTTLSLPTTGTYVVVDGVTETFAPASETGESGVTATRPSEGTGKESGTEELKSTATSTRSGIPSATTTASHSSIPARISSTAGVDNGNGGDSLSSGSQRNAVLTGDYLAAALLLTMLSLATF